MFRKTSVALDKLDSGSGGINGRQYRIAHVVEATGGGVAKHVADLTRIQSERGHEVFVYYSSLRADKKFLEYVDGNNKLSAIEIPMRRAVGPQDFVSYTRLLFSLAREAPFDIIHCHSSKAGALARLLPRSLSRTCIYTPHALRTMDPSCSGLPWLVFGAIERFLANYRTAAILAGSRQEADAALEIGIRANKVEIIPFGVTAASGYNRISARRKLGVPDGGHIIGFVGRLVAQKNPAEALYIMANISARNTYLVVMGEGPLRNELFRLVDQLGLQERVRIVPNLVAADYMQAFDVLLVTSRYESLGYVLLEALASGVPFVSTDVGISSELAAEFAGCAIYKDGEYASAAESITNIIDASAGAESDGAANTARLGRSRNIKEMADQVTRIYDRCLQGVNSK